MDAAHFGSGNRICTVVFVDIVGYSEEAVSQQADTKARFTRLLADALEQTPAADRLVLDTGDGAALCFLGDPEDALFAANTLRSRVRETPPPLRLRLRLGINLGPVRVVKDVAGHPNVIGDGINVAQRVMNFAEPDQILVSRSFYEVVSRLSPEYAHLFQYAGLHRDKHVREHEVYAVQLSAPTGPRAESVDDVAAPPAPADRPGAPRPGTAPAPRFDPALIARLTAALAREIGPVAKLVVRRAAAETADARALREALAESVPAASRASFLAAFADLAPPPPAGSRSAEGGAPAPEGTRSSAAERRREIEPALLARAEQMLARRIGPLARVLVREAARHATSPRDLFERLAVHIDDAEIRKVFVAEADRLS